MVRARFVVLGVLALGIGGTLALQPLLRPPADGPVAGGGEAGGVEQGHVMTYAFEKPYSLNPLLTDSQFVRRYVIGFTHNSLLDLDPATGGLRGALASSWQVDPDGRAVTFTLRDGVRFADGAPLTLDDVLFTFALKDEIGWGGVRLVDHVEVLTVTGAPARLRAVLKAPQIDAVQLVGMAWVVVEKAFFTRRIAELAAHTGEPPPAPGDKHFCELLAGVRDPGPGTGPYWLPFGADLHSDWQQGILLARNDASWTRAARPGSWNFAGIRIRFLSDPIAQVAALHDRALDVYTLTDAERQFDRDPALQRDYRCVAYEPPYLSVWMVEWNLKQPKLQDVRVRRALSMLFDRRAIVRDLLHGNGSPAVAYSRPNRPGYPQDLPVTPFDPAGARRLLAEAGFDAAAGRPLRVSILTAAELPAFRQVLDGAADAARQAGIELVPQVIAFQEVGARLDKGDFDGALLLKSDITGVGDPYEVFHTDGGSNQTGWSNADADRLLEQARKELDAAARNKVLARFHALVAEEQPVSFLVHPGQQLLINSHVQNATPGPLGLWPERFWVPKAFQRN
jgi:peptide/nickel transport system substrate-binding protein